MLVFSQELSKTLSVFMLKAEKEKNGKDVTTEPALILMVFWFNVAWKHVMMAECCGYLLDWVPNPA